MVAMPLHWRKRWERGFNQSELLAKEIARRCGVPWCWPCGGTSNAGAGGTEQCPQARECGGRLSRRGGE